MINEILQLKKIVQRANNHIGVVYGTANFLFLAILLMKSFNIFTPIRGIILCISISFLIFIIGYLDSKLRIYDREISINNQHNPELRKIIRLLEEKK